MKNNLFVVLIVGIVTTAKANDTAIALSPFSSGELYIYNNELNDSGIKLNDTIVFGETIKIAFTHNNLYTTQVTYAGGMVVLDSITSLFCAYNKNIVVESNFGQLGEKPEELG